MGDLIWELTFSNYPNNIIHCAGMLQHKETTSKRTLTPCLGQKYTSKQVGVSNDIFTS